MGGKLDIRDIVNPHPACSRSVQEETLAADSKRMGYPASEVYTNDASDAPRKAGIRSARPERKSLVRAMWLFNLAPVEGTAQEKRKAITTAIKFIVVTRRCVFREAATGLQSNRPGDLAAMSAKASEMVGNYGRGAAGRSKQGRPRKEPDAETRRTMREEWKNRDNVTVADAIAALAARSVKTNKNELYRLFGKRG